MAVVLETPVEELRLRRYHLMVLLYFVGLFLAQYAVAYRYAGAFPAEWRGLFLMTVVMFFLFQSLFMVAVVPLGMLFIYCWLYLIDIRARARSLYAIVATSLLPFLVLLGLILIYVVAIMDVHVPPTSDIQKLNELIRADLMSKRFPVRGLGLAAAILSVLICAYQIRQRLGLSGLLRQRVRSGPTWLQRVAERVDLSVVVALLIPLTFVGSLYAFNRVGSALAGNVWEKLNLPIPPPQ
jgi:MFS family permease